MHVQLVQSVIVLPAFINISIYERPGYYYSKYTLDVCLTFKIGDISLICLCTLICSGRIVLFDFYV